MLVNSWNPDAQQRRFSVLWFQENNSPVGLAKQPIRLNLIDNLYRAVLVFWFRVNLSVTLFHVSQENILRGSFGFTLDNIRDVKCNGVSSFCGRFVAIRVLLKQCQKPSHQTGLGIVYILQPVRIFQSVIVHWTIYWWSEGDDLMSAKQGSVSRATFRKCC